MTFSWILSFLLAHLRFHLKQSWAFSPVLVLSRLAPRTGQTLHTQSRRQHRWKLHPAGFDLGPWLSACIWERMEKALQNMFSVWLQNCVPWPWEVALTPRRSPQGTVPWKGPAFPMRSSPKLPTPVTPLPGLTTLLDCVGLHKTVHPKENPHLLF